MIIDTTTRTFGIATPPSGTATNNSTSSTDASFEAQLSSALADSLQKLGMNTDEVNITIRNPTANTRQIMVTYSVNGTAEAVIPEPPRADALPSTTNPAPSATSNPFSGYTPYIAPAATTPVVDSTAWAPYNGPKDARDEVPTGGGQATTSGAPRIVDNEKSAANQYGYTGPATKNPYFTTPSNPLREGYVMGFRKWFADPMIVGGLSGPMPANKIGYATEEGAQEALRIVKQFAPNAEVVQSVWQSGPFSVDKPLYEIKLGGGGRLNAGGVLAGYYNQGYGVTISSDETIRRSMQLA